MSKDFPFTTYDFYAYLASGLFFLFSLDLIFTGGVIFSTPTWNFVQIAVVIAISYISGQILAIPSSAIVEHFMFNWIFFKPLVLLTGSRKPRWREWVLGKLIGRYYEPFSLGTREKILAKASEATGKPEADLLADPELIFQPAFAAARQSADTCTRIDDFRNQYGFARNICFVGVVLLLIGIWYGSLSNVVLTLLGILIVGMFIRFAKFYAAFCSDVLRALAYAPQAQKDASSKGNK